MADQMTPAELRGAQPLWEDPPAGANAAHDAAREIYAAADELQSDLDRLEIALASGGTYPEMRDAVTAYRIHSETAGKLRDIAARIARGDTTNHENRSE